MEFYGHSRKVEGKGVEGESTFALHLQQFFSCCSPVLQQFGQVLRSPFVVAENSSGFWVI